MMDETSRFWEVTPLQYIAGKVPTIWQEGEYTELYIVNSKWAVFRPDGQIKILEPENCYCLMLTLENVEAPLRPNTSIRLTTKTNPSQPALLSFHRLIQLEDRAGGLEFEAEKRELVALKVVYLPNS